MPTVLLLNGGSVADATGRHTLIANTGTVTSDGSRLVFDGASGLRIDDNLEDFSFSGPFTIEGELVGDTSTVVATLMLLSNYNGGGSWQMFYRGPGASFRGGIYAEGATFMEPNGHVWATDAPVPFAFTWDGTTSRLFLNGNVIASDTPGSADFTQNTVGPLYIGMEGPYAGGGKFLLGKLRLRIINGEALYTGPYTPPAWTILSSAKLTADQAVDPGAQAVALKAIASLTAAQTDDAPVQAAVLAAVASLRTDQAVDAAAQTVVVRAIAKLLVDQLMAPGDQVAMLHAVPPSRSIWVDQLVPAFAQIVRFGGPYVFTANNRTYVVDAQERVFSIPPQSRVFAVAPQNRVHSPTPENRSFRVEA
ncbi:MAG: hypothetical protein EOP82_32630 [Variovorax sp.]|nr:MAG: hypothetical protein EOP82_32630 [Variovorax sp.]